MAEQHSRSIWDVYLGKVEPKRIEVLDRSTSRVIESRLRIRPIKKDAVVSSFSDWVFWLNHPLEYQDALIGLAMRKARLDHGKYVERGVEHQRSVETRASNFGDWEAVYVDQTETERTAFESRTLFVSGEPLRGRPDLVFQNRKTKAIIIVERKAPRGTVMPLDGWPNMRAQLWAYAHLEPWASAPEITLIGEAWASNGSRFSRLHAWRWTLNDRAFYEEQKNLFDRYCSIEQIKFAAPRC